jgi:RND family efflux transporter MFP subunit
MKKLIQPLIFLGIIGLGILIYTSLKSTKEKPKRVDAAEMETVVNTLLAKPSVEKVAINAIGKVIPARSVIVLPEVAGRIIYVSPKLIPGSYYRKGEVLARIDPRDYDLFIKQNQAAVAQAKLQLATEEGRKAVAEQEWKLIEKEVQPTEAGKKLALREIQLESALSALASAEANLDLAKLRRERTIIRAPFNALVADKFIDQGQVVSNASRIASLVAADTFWVRVSLPVDKLKWIQLPSDSRQGSAAAVAIKIGGKKIVAKDGKVIKRLTSLDPKGKLAQLLVAVDDPFSTKNPGDSGLGLFLDAHVDVTIEGQDITDVFPLPRQALREDDRIWIKSIENKLEVREVEVVWSTLEQVYLRGNLAAGEEVIISNIAVPIPGMTVKSNQANKGPKNKPVPIAEPQVDENNKEAYHNPEG